jgi:hypothetical protein
VNNLIAKHAAGLVFGAGPCSWSRRARYASTAGSICSAPRNGPVISRSSSANLPIIHDRFVEAFRRYYDFLPKADPSHDDVESRRERQPETVTPSMPKNTAVPSDWRISARAPCAIASGTTPKMKASEVIKIGLRRVQAA